MASVVGVPSLTVVRENAAAILAEHRRPIYYIDLAGMVLDRLEWNYDTAVKTAVAEDLREKILVAGQNNLDYSGPPGYYAWMKRWFPRGQRLFSEYRIRIPLTRDQAMIAAIEGMLRFQYVKNKPSDGKEKLAERIANGFVTEKVISGWFRQNWPRAWQPAENDGKWDRYCDHDFRLSLLASGGILKVDVAGVGGDGLVGVRRWGKPKAELHVIGVGHHVGVDITGYQTGDAFVERLRAPIETQSAEVLEVLMNAETQGIPFFKLVGGLKGLAGQR